MISAHQLCLLPVQPALQQALAGAARVGGHAARVVGANADCASDQHI